MGGIFRNKLLYNSLMQAHKLDAVALCNAFCEIEHLLLDGNQLTEL